MAKIFYTKHDVVNLWNSLPPTVSFTSLSSLRQRYAMFFFWFYVLLLVLLFVCLWFVSENQCLTTFPWSSRFPYRRRSHMERPTGRRHLSTISSRLQKTT